MPTGTRAAFAFFSTSSMALWTSGSAGFMPMVIERSPGPMKTPSTPSTARISSALSTAIRSSIIGIRITLLIPS